MFVRGCVERRLVFFSVFCIVFVKTAEGTESKTNFPSVTIKYILSYLIDSQADGEDFRRDTHPNFNRG